MKRITIIIAVLLLGLTSLTCGKVTACDNKKEFSELSGDEFKARYLPKPLPGTTVYAIDFIEGRTDSEAIEKALSTRKPGQSLKLVLDRQTWIIDRAIILPSHTELVISNCTLKHADGVFDNFIRVAGIKPKPDDPHGVCDVEPTEDIRIIGLGNAVISGADKPYVGINPKTGNKEKYISGIWGWRNIGIVFSRTSGYEVSGIKMINTYSWAITQGQCTRGYIHDITFDIFNVPNGDGVNFRNGCSFSYVENIFGSTGDDTIACTALDGSYFTPESPYIYPLQPAGLKFEGDHADIHDIIIRNIYTGGVYRGVICLASTPKIYNIYIDRVFEDGIVSPCRFLRDSVVLLYTDQEYGAGYKPGNIHNIRVSNVVASGARNAFQIWKAQTKDVHCSNIQQLNNNPYYKKKLYKINVKGKSCYKWQEA